jgi:hypothetical protein
MDRTLTGSNNADVMQEEFACLSGSCIAKQHVCDGEHDCPGGEDERECRKFGSLFTLDEGYRLQGKSSFVAKHCRGCC